MANASGFSLASILGDISPKVMMITVIMAVAAQAPLSPIRPTAITVAKEEDPMFTRLFPTRMAISTLPNCSLMLHATAAAPVRAPSLFFPCCLSRFSFRIL